MMRRIILFILPLLLFPPLISASVSENADTLLNASSASKITIQANPARLTVSVSNVNGTTDDFFYQTGNPAAEKVAEQSRLEYIGVGTVCIIESDDKMLIDFKTTGDESHEIVLNIPDPANRYVRCWLGSPVNDFGINLSRSVSTVWDMVSGGLGFGLVTPVNSDPSLSTSMGRSWEIMWTIVLGVKMKHGQHSVRAGVGLDWRNYVTKGDRYFHCDDDGHISMEPYGEEMRKHRSRIKVFSLQVPVLYGFSFGRNRSACGVEIGPVVNFNTGGSIKTQYKIGDRDYSVKKCHIDKRPVTVDVMATFRYKSIGLYARYAPMNVLKDSAGMKFGAFSTGIMFGF